MQPPALALASFVPALYLPRRHRRRLLFPPGLLALAGLLWLGCVAVGWWQRELAPSYVMWLTMPPLSRSDTLMPNLARILPAQDNELLLYSQLPTFCPWQDIEFTGNLVHDSVSQIKVQSAITQLGYNIENYLYRNRVGVRIRFRLHASYGMLIASLDVINNHNIKKFLVDSRPSKNNFIIYCLPPQPRRNEEFPMQNFCGTSSCLPILAVPAKPTEGNSLNNWGFLLLHSQWWLSLLIAFALVFLNILQMVRSQLSMQ